MRHARYAKRSVRRLRSEAYESKLRHGVFWTARLQNLAKSEDLNAPPPRHTLNLCSTGIDNLLKRAGVRSAYFNRNFVGSPRPLVSEPRHKSPALITCIRYARLRLFLVAAPTAITAQTAQFCVLLPINLVSPSSTIMDLN